jgi:polysaccharide export outer membrane protein
MNFSIIYHNSMTTNSLNTSWWTRFFVAISFALTGCVQGGGFAMLPQPAVQSYRLGAGDHIRVITYDESQLTNTFTVGADGTISFPLIGTIAASGLTVTEFAALISSSLSQGQFISQPSVSVQVTDYRPISVLGEVNHPGQYPYQPGMNMLDAVALAGGFTYRAVTSGALDWRHEAQNSSRAVQGKLSPSSGLEPGDVITVSERFF